MSGDVMIAHDLYWPQNTNAWSWALTVLAAEVTRPGARAALEEALEAHITMDVEALPVEDRDDVYVTASRVLVPAAVGRFGDAEPFDDLADMAREALRRYRGKQVADFEVRLSPTVSWWTHTSFFSRINYFLSESLSNREVARGLEYLNRPDEPLLDLTGWAAADQREAMTLLRDRFVRDMREISPPDSVTTEHDMARARELAELAGEVLARPDLRDGAAG